MRTIFTAVAAFASCLPAYAAVSVTQNLGASWVGSPTIMVAGSPLTSKEGNWGGSAPYSLGQSFTTPVSGVLTNIQLYGSGRATAGILLYLYDMGPALQYQAGQPASVISGSNSVTTVVGGNLFSTNLAFTVQTTASDQVLQLAFSGADAVPLIGGHEYMFALVSTNSSPMYWDDGGGSVYPGGAAYRQNSFINGSGATTFSLAVTLAGTNAAPAIHDCVVDWNIIHQRIDGFGASSAWRSAWTAAQADMFFSTNSGTGASLDGKTTFPFTGVDLSLLRTRIAPGGTTVENSIMQLAQVRGASVWSTPWSPQTTFISGTVDGGTYLGSGTNPTNLAYASQLAGYVVSMKSLYGVNISALSLQNEPDVQTSYESCAWTAQQFHDFVPCLHNALVASNVASTKILLAEDEHWETNYYYTAMADPAVATNVSIVACHNYDGSPPNNLPVALSPYANTNAALWETEVGKLSSTGAFDPSMNDAMYWAGRLHQFMTVAKVNAWHYWWLISANPDNEGLTDTNGIPAQRMYVLGQYSRFVRPGNYRIDLANYNPYAVLATAYKDPVANGFAVVVANTNPTPTTQSFLLTNFTATTVTPWVTASNLSLAAQSPVPVTNNSFSYTVPAMSVVTFAGQGQLVSTPPVPNPIPPQTNTVGLPLLVTDTAQDANPPLSWNLLSGPTNATLTSGGLFAWTPLPSQAASTNTITVQVTDNAGLSATNSFMVIVNPLNGTNATVTTLVSPVNSAPYGTALTFTATVSPPPANGETVAFLAGAAILGTGILSGGSASYTTSATQLAVTATPYALTAVYAGDGNDANSASGVVTQAVTAVTVTVASGLTANRKTYNGTASATLNSNNVVLSGIVPADVGNVQLSTNGYTAAFASPNAGTGLGVTVGGLALTGSAAGNYTLTPPALGAGIVPATVTLAPGSGSLRISNNFTAGNNQFEVYNGLNGFSPALNGALFTNFQCDVRFAPGSATQTNTSGVVVFGHLQFGMQTNGGGQDYFGGTGYGIDVPATNTGWVHVRIPLSVASDASLAGINDLLIHIYGPYGSALVGPSALWVDNLQFAGPGTNYIVDQFNPAGSGGNSYSAGQINNVWKNWFGASWVANTWDTNYDASGVTANDKPYDGTTNATVTQYDSLLNASLSGVVSRDLPDVSLATNGYLAAFAGAGVGTNLVVTASLALAGRAGANYTIPPLTLSASISKLPVTANAVANNKVYDGGTQATLNAALIGAISGDNVSLNSNAFNATFGSAGVGNNLAVTVAGWALAGSAAGNYALITAVPTNLTADITPATAVVAANPETKTSGLPNPVLTATYHGLVNGEGTNVLATLAGLTTTANAASPAGDYPITASGATAANYVFNYAPGTLSVVALPVLAGVSVGANNYQFTFPTLTGQMYQVEYKTSLTDPVWQLLGPPVSGTGGSLSVTNNSTTSQGYFWLQILPP